ncbi:hypothetical protein [Anaeromyxobacter dehalogenans]|uniref:Uncharacterized protein n=1 Tax=Anaeromyxobacter dehalogenans (strain 2CP-C) TaxID=290397 RepID=Q2IFK5_ANADE|nr:hypothetical protein [Anaeromyxobacter dehalogenans]ABC83363.1 hypothetical protein Adeh_3597 [Anaeromyxobacter dehalogenans 2CP-C]
MTRRTMQRAKVERPGDVGIDLPAGAAAEALRPSDYHLVEMEPAEPRPVRAHHGPRAHAAEVERPGDVGMDLPAGAAAAELRPSDYHPVEMEPATRGRAKRRTHH